MPELVTNITNNYQYWKDLEEKGLISIEKICSNNPEICLVNFSENRSKNTFSS